MECVTAIEAEPVEEEAPLPTVEVEARVLEERIVNHGFLFREAANRLQDFAEGVECVELRPARGRSAEEYTMTASPSACRAFFSLPGASVELVRSIVAAYFTYASMEDAPICSACVWVPVDTVLRELHRTQGGTVQRVRDLRTEHDLVDACLEMLATVRIQGRGPKGELFGSRYLLPLEKLPFVAKGKRVLRDVWGVNVSSLNYWDASTGLQGGFVSSYPLLRFDRPATLIESSMHVAALDLIHELRGRAYSSKNRQDVTLSRLWAGIAESCNPPKRTRRGEFIEAFERVLLDCAAREAGGELYGSRRVYLDAWTEMGQGRGKGREYRKLRIRASRRQHPVRVELLGFWDGDPSTYRRSIERRGL